MPSRDVARTKIDTAIVIMRSSPLLRWQRMQRELSFTLQFLLVESEIKFLLKLLKTLIQNSSRFSFRQTASFDKLRVAFQSLVRKKRGKFKIQTCCRATRSRLSVESLVEEGMTRKISNWSPLVMH